MDYAEVCVNSPAARRQTFSYSVPSHLEVVPGQAVLVPFGAQILQGIVLGLTAEPAVEQTRDIAGIVETRPLLSPERIKLARWISDYYLASLFEGVALMLPPGFERRVLTFVSLLIPEGFDISSLPVDQKQVVEEVAKRSNPVSMSALESLFGKKKTHRLIPQLVKKQIFVRSYEFEPIKVRVKTDCFYSLAINPAQARQEAVKLRSRAKRQADILELLSGQQLPISVKVIKQKLNFSKTAADVLVKKHLINVSIADVRRDPLARLKTVPSAPMPLTANQTYALEEIKNSLKKKAVEFYKPAVFLLHGVTGSGKTEVYLQALAEVVRSGKKGIALVPEIALTPQALERFTARFPGRVAILHSQLSLGEQFDEWNRIRNGEVDVVIGPRSALFAPQPDLGLIVIDEEHEWNYKQTDRSPYYHARTAALKLAEITGASVILGSATPDVQTYYHARKSNYRLLELPERLVSVPETDSTQAGEGLPKANGDLPQVKIVDMREELKLGNRGLFSRALQQSISHALSAGGQVILFLNRRGYSTFLQCRRCGFSFRCRRCDVPMIYHSAEGALICHQCNYRLPTPVSCPRCRSPQIKFLGIGTEKLEQETAQIFPRARLLRWDSDTTRGWHEHQVILDKFRRQEAEILIGTQMVSKGLDMPQVILVGIINADTGLNLPDFRAGERTFQLLSQVAGRAGRGPMGGQVIIQTYSPDHYAVQAAQKHDYRLFYDKEITYRRELRQPPFSELISLIYNHTNESRCRKEAERLRGMMVKEKEGKGLSNIEILGPAPAFISRRRGHFRWQLVLRGSNLRIILSEIAIPRGWKIDVDPVGFS